MIDLKILEDCGVTNENLRRKLAIDPLNVPNGPEGSEPWKIGKLIHRIRSRIQEGMTRNFSDFRLFYTLDQAWDVPFKQLSPTMIASFIDQDPNSEEVYKKFQDWGLTHMINEEVDPKTNKPVKKFNLPVFFNIFVPLVKAYVTIRWAKIMNDRRLQPFFKYEPIKLTTPLSLKCEALTDRIQVIANQYGYFDVTKQAVLKMLHYSQCFQFPKAEWHWESQLKHADETDVANGAKKWVAPPGPKPVAPSEMPTALRTPLSPNEMPAPTLATPPKESPQGDQPASAGDMIEVRTREGIAYQLPHPTRVYYDLAHGPFTLNYDYGCEYAGYWRIARYREIQGSTFWNREKIALGTVDLVSGNRLFFTTVYSACTLTVPTRTVPSKTPDGPTLGAELGLGAGSLDREKEIATLYYGTEHGDQGVLVTEHFERLVPSENGLGNYDYPVWFRFVVAGDGCTILYAAPLPYSPVIYYGYDADESRTKNASLSLEVLPWQDHFSNTLTQILLTAKQNLANMTFVDEDQLMTGDPSSVNQGGKTTLDKIRNIGEGLYRYLNVFSYSGKKSQRMLAGQRQPVVESFNFPRGNVAELTNVLRELLNTLERVLVMSSQEVAQAASHELRVDEVRNISASTSSRLVFTSTPIDIARDAWKRQLYQGLMAYGDEDMWVHIPSDVPLNEEALIALGFTFHEKESMTTGRDQFRRASIKKSRVAMALWEFSSTRDGEDRSDNSKVAMAMGQLVQNLLNNPVTAQAIGADQAIDIANQMSRLIGLPKDFKLKNATPTAPPEGSQENATPPAPPEGSQGPMQKILESVNYKDLPPDIQRQFEQKLGFQPSQTGGSSPAEEHIAKIAQTQQAVKGRNGAATPPSDPQAEAAEAQAQRAHEANLQMAGQAHEQFMAGAEHGHEHALAAADRQAKAHDYLKQVVEQVLKGAQAEMQQNLKPIEDQIAQLTKIVESMKENPTDGTPA